jgi:hypothetical protein
LKILKEGNRKNQRKTDNTMARRQRTKDIKGGKSVKIKERQTIQ